MIVTHRGRLPLDFDHALVTGAINIGIQAECKEVLVMWCHQHVRHALSVRIARRCRVSGETACAFQRHDPGERRLLLDRTIFAEDPGEAILVVAEG